MRKVFQIFGLPVLLVLTLMFIVFPKQQPLSQKPQVENKMDAKAAWQKFCEQQTSIKQAAEQMREKQFCVVAVGRMHLNCREHQSVLDKVYCIADLKRLPSAKPQSGCALGTYSLGTEKFSVERTLAHRASDGSLIYKVNSDCKANLVQKLLVGNETNQRRLRIADGFADAGADELIYKAQLIYAHDQNYERAWTDVIPQNQRISDQAWNKAPSRYDWKEFHKIGIFTSEQIERGK